MQVQTRPAPPPFSLTEIVAKGRAKLYAIPFIRKGEIRQKCESKKRWRRREEFHQTTAVSTSQRPELEEPVLYRPGRYHPMVSPLKSHVIVPTFCPISRHGVRALTRSSRLV
jgi:hypothetical protein